MYRSEMPLQLQRWMRTVAWMILEITHALRAAEQGLMADESDPAAHWAMGGALWLAQHTDPTLRELDRAVELSPQFAQEHYMLAFGDPRAALACAELAERLSPFDPMMFATIATRAMAHLRLDEYETAAALAADAISRPNAHVHISGIAVHCYLAAGQIAQARATLAQIRRTHPHYSLAEYLRAFRFAAPAAALLRKVAGSIGLS